MRDAIYLRRRHRVNDICGHVITESVQGASFSAKLSHAMMHPLTRVPMLLALLAGMYVVIGQWVAGGVVGFLEVGVMQVLRGRAGVEARTRVRRSGTFLLAGGPFQVGRPREAPIFRTYRAAFPIVMTDCALSAPFSCV